MDSKMISVLIPVYNIEKKQRKLKLAIRSVLEQSYRNLELIIINDGSNDNSAIILQKLQALDNRIRIVTKENGGVESARREGLKNAQGDFILHMDQDDIYRYDAFEVFLHKMEETNADVVIANHTRFIFSRFFNFGKCNTPSMQEERVIGHDEFMKNFYVSFFGINDIPVNIWNKMYRRKFLDNCPTPPLTGQIIEDLSYNMHILPYAEKIAVIPKVLYFYRWGGFSNRFDTTILDTALIGYQYKNKMINQYGLDDFKIPTSIELLNYVNGLFLQYVEYNILNKEKFISEVERICAMPEVIESLKIVQFYDNYHREYIDTMLAHDYENLYNYELRTKNKHRIRRMIKSVLLKM